MAITFNTPPPAIPADAHVLISFPAPHVLHVAFNRPAKWNALTAMDNRTLDAVWTWYEAEPSLRCAVLGTTDRKAWCAGGDLKELVSDKK
jgi:enoyl-CoA hydratase/carnithine racemase